MKKSIIGALVGGIILFMWQFLSWTAINLHSAAQQYTPKQDSIMSYLGSSLGKQGGYYIPGAPVGTSFEEMEKLALTNVGKPWASIQYHEALEYNMGLNMARSLAVDIALVWILCWLLGKFSKNSFGTSFTVSIAMGIFVYLNGPYTGHIWYPIFDIRAYLIDFIVMWGLTGVWLGWWLNRKSAA
ncbi:MAG: hypothetical protein EAZ13_10010 [Sphingobacteriia bacterium]|jgi:hypothetical protein|nr:MAG: hypothetical protein EAZ35_08695 [Sphingobacteriia bacterium]TAH06249.1 MAG: hypothetical protein EAZ13_10010 [Sphingobacteriia bacterium]